MTYGAMSWRARLLLERGLAIMYLVAFVVAVRQFVPLAGAHGLTPAAEFIARVPFRFTPSLFYLGSSDASFRAAAWTGTVLSLVVLAGLPSRAGSAAAGASWLLLWLLYLSFVNVGGIFYGFGWETLLLEAGLAAVFLGGRRTTPSATTTWLFRWIAFRVMFGAGLIKVRGDACWHDLTCLDSYFETQPMPNPLSWYFHWLPPSIHHGGVVLNHVVELIVPFLFFAPQPIAGIAGVVTIAFQLVLILSGNLSWLNWLTIVLVFAALDDRFLRWLPARMPALAAPGRPLRAVTAAYAVLVVALSINPVMNLLSPGQVMNTSFDPLHVVNTYGAFGSITRARNEIVIEGTLDAAPGKDARWTAYRVRRQARRSGEHAPAVRALSSAARLADVVRGDGGTRRRAVVRRSAPPAARGRSRRAVAPSVRPVRGPAADVRPRRVLRLPLHHAGRTRTHGPLVDANAPRAVLPRRLVEVTEPLSLTNLAQHVAAARSCAAPQNSLRLARNGPRRA